MLKQLNDHHIADEKYDFQRQQASAGRAAVNGADAKLGMATKLFRVVGPATKVGEAAALAEYVFDGPTSENGARQGEKKTARGSKSAKRPRERKSWDTPRLLRSWPWHQLFEQPLSSNKAPPRSARNYQKNPTKSPKPNFGPASMGHNF